VRLGLGCILLIVVGPVAAAADPADPAVDAIVADSLRRWGTPGVAVAVVRADEPVHLHGYGVREVGRPAPVTADTLFAFGSCTKAITSAVVAKLADDGKMSFDEPARTHLPGYRLTDPAADALVTVRDLLAHRTGVDGHDLLWYRAPWPAAEAVAKLSHLPAAGPFRASYHYSSLQYIAAGRAAAAAGGKPWDRLARDLFAAPLGMTATTFATAEAKAHPDRAAGHHRTAAGIEVMPEYELAEPNPAGSVATTARDLVPWLRFQLGNGAVGGRRLVSAANLAETRRPHTVMPMSDPGIGPVYPDTAQASYAMGWVVYDHRGLLVNAHGGVIDGFRAQVTLVPGKNVGIALLNNLHQTRMNVALTNRLIDYYCGLPARDWDDYYLKLEAAEKAAKVAGLEDRDRQRRGTPPSAPTAAYAGTYIDVAYGEATIIHAAGRLTWAWGNLSVPLAHYDGDVFRFTAGPAVDELVEFRVERGTPTAMRCLTRVFGRK